MKNKMGNLQKAIIIAGTIVAILVIMSIISYSLKTKEVAKLEDIDVNLAEKVNENIEELLEPENEEQELIEEDEKESEEEKKNNTYTKPYYIKVNYGAQVVTVYSKDEQGNYTVPVRAMVCSTGSATPRSGVYATPAKWEWHELMGGVYGHYCTQIVRGILFHSVPYLRRDPASLEYWAYDKLGTYASAGCIRLMVKDSKWIFENCEIGTKVEFYSSSDPGPLGKPSAKKISSYPDYVRNWDPTDVNPDNPWHSYNEQTPTEPPKEEIKEDPPEEPKNEENNTIENEINNIIDNTLDNSMDNTMTNETNNEIINNATN